jgi:MFS family permease
VTALFVILGIGVGSLASRLPAIKASLHLSTGTLGLALLGTALGSVLSTPVTGAVLARVAPRRWIALGLLPFAAFLPVVALAGGPVSLLLVLTGYGFGMGCVDVAMNTEATRVEALTGRRIMSGIHATFSVGSLVGAGVGAVLAATSIGFAAQFVAVGATVLVGGLVAVGLLPDVPVHGVPVHGVPVHDVPVHDAPGAPVGIRGAPNRGAAPVVAATPTVRPGRSLPELRWGLVALAVICSSYMLCEGAANDWSAVYLRTSAGTSAAVGAAGYAAFSAAMVVGRFGGDRVTTRWGPVRVVRTAAVLGAVGMTASLVIGDAAVGIAGFVLLGFGLAVGVPLAISAASGLGTAGPSVALVTSCGYLGFLAGPPVIGGLSTVLSLRLALGLVVVLLVGLAVLAGSLRAPRPSATPPVATLAPADC